MNALVKLEEVPAGIPTALTEVIGDGAGDDPYDQESSPAIDNDGKQLPGIDRKPDSSAEHNGSDARSAYRERSVEPREHPWEYRDRTVALLKQYARMAVESGRLPSLLGRECFRTRVTPYAMASFEDMAIFVHDMERALRRLDNFQRQLITLNVLEEFSQWEIARLLGCTTRWIEWQVSDALDELSGVLVWSGLVRKRAEGNGGEPD